MMTVLVPQSPGMIDQIPPGVREVIHQLFVTHSFPASQCDQMLESLLQYAHFEHQGLPQHGWCNGKIVIHNLLKTYRADRVMQEACCYQTLHIFVRLLCTLGILKKQVISSQPTMYLLPRDSDYRFQVSATVLAGIDRLTDPTYTKNPKMRRKAHDVKERLLHMDHVIGVNLNTSLLEDSSPLMFTIESPETLDLGDSLSKTPMTESTRREIPGDSSSNVQVTESPKYVIVGDSISRSKQRSEHESPKEDKNLPDASSSSIDSIHSNRISSQKELELESETSEQWTGSEEELSLEAVRYLKLLDGSEYATPDYLNTHAGKKALGGYKNKIRRSPTLARIAAINTFLHRTFYDLTRQKKPLENAGKWFHSSFDRYADQQRPMEITGEILDWAKSPYTLEEIASVLLQERKRQETQWWCSESPHLPFSSCVVVYRYLQEDASILQMSIAEQHQESFLLETARQSAGSHWMNCTEAELLADEIRHEASWYLDEIHVHPAPQLGENAYVVEATITEIPLPVVYALRQDWWLHHQEQLRHQVREEQRKDKKEAREKERRMR